MKKIIYDKLTDEELCKLSKEGDQEATNRLISRYKPFVRGKANTLFLMGGDMEDLIQEGMIGLFMALRDYNEEKKASFKTFAGICVIGQMHQAIKSANRNKHMPLNAYLSLDASNEEEGNALSEIEVITDNDPENLYIDRENVSNLMAKVKEALSKLEWEVFSLYIEGKDYREIAENLGKEVKAIDNALSRIKKKIEKLLS